MEKGKNAWVARMVAWVHTVGRRRLLVAAGVAGMVLIALSEWWPRGAESPTSPAADAAAYVTQTERRLTELVESIAGAGTCRVMVTLENGVEYVYATEQKTNTDRQEDTDDGATRLTQRDDTESAAILVDTGDGREGLLVTEIQPTVRGVVVACEGGDSTAVCERVTQAVTVALNVSSRRVCVTKLS